MNVILSGLKVDAERFHAEARAFWDAGNVAAGNLLFGKALGIIWALWIISEDK